MGAENENPMTPGVVNQTPETVTVEHLDSHDLGLGDAFAKFKETQNAPADTLNPEPKPTEEPKPSEEPKPAEEPKPSEEPKPAAEPEDEFAPLKLPKHARSETARQFDEAKRIGREYRAKAKEYEAELAKLRTAAPKAIDEETAKELEEHRKFRRLHDFSNSPQFTKEFVKPIAAEEKEIEGMLKDVGFADEAIAQAKKIGLRKVDWDAALHGVPSLEKTAILTSLTKLHALERAKDGALKAASEEKEAHENYLKGLPDPEVSRLEASVKGAEEIVANSRLLDEIDPTKPLPEGVLSKEHAEAVNAGAKQAAAFLKAYGTDVSPRTVAELLAIGAGAQRYLSVNKFLHSEVQARTARIAELEKQLGEANAKYAGVKRAGAAPGIPTGGSPTPAPQDMSEGSMRERFSQFRAGGVG